MLCSGVFNYYICYFITIKLNFSAFIAASQLNVKGFVHGCDPSPLHFLKNLIQVYNIH